MKKPLYYAIRTNAWSPRVVAVTLERGRRWWGRTVTDDLGTHGRDTDIRGRFDTQEGAEGRALDAALDAVLATCGVL